MVRWLVSGIGCVFLVFVFGCSCAGFSTDSKPVLPPSPAHEMPVDGPERGGDCGGVV